MSSAEDISDLIQPFGRWHLLTYLQCLINKLIGSFQTFAPIFIAARMEFVCTSGPSSEVSAGMNRSAAEDSCYVNNATAGIVQECQKWEYTGGIFNSTIVSEFDLVCHRSWLVSLSTSVFMAGIAVGLLVLGHLADWFGRKPVMVAGLFLMVSAGIGSALSTSIYVFICCRFVIAFGQAGVSQISFVYCSELIPTAKRYYLMPLIMAGWATGIIFLSLLAWSVRSWIQLQLIISTVPAVLWILLWIVQLESPRWLVVRGNLEKATSSIQTIHKLNGTFAPGLESRISDIRSELERQSDSPSRGFNNVLDLFRTPKIRKQTLIMFYLWPVCSFYYYGINLRVDVLPGDIFLNFAMGGMMELVGICLLIPMMRLLSRKRLLALLLCLMALLGLLTLAIVPEDNPLLSIILFLGAKMAAACTFDMLYMVCSESYPTVVRSLGLTTISLVARLGSILAPFQNEMADLMPNWPRTFPTAFCGVLVSIGVFLTLFLRETKDLQIPDTIQDVEGSPRV